MKNKLHMIILGLLGFGMTSLNAAPASNIRYCGKQTKSQTNFRTTEKNMATQKVYKLFTEAQWKKFHEEGEFYGSPVDLKDGFIHLSSPAQVARVKDKYYANVRPLYIIEFQGESWLKTLKWEAASNGDLYPHLYDAPLKFENVFLIEICR